MLPVRNWVSRPGRNTWPSANYRSPGAWSGISVDPSSVSEGRLGCVTMSNMTSSCSRRKGRTACSRARPNWLVWHRRTSLTVMETRWSRSFPLIDSSAGPISSKPKAREGYRAQCIEYGRIRRDGGGMMSRIPVVTSGCLLFWLRNVVTVAPLWF